MYLCMCVCVCIYISACFCVCNHREISVKYSPELIYRDKMVQDSLIQW